MCTHHPLFLSRSAHDISPVIVHVGEILMWNGAYEMEVVKGDSTDGDVEVTWALGATLPPTRPAPAWQLLHAVPEWKQAKESKKEMWTMTCQCECEVCIVFYPVFAQSLRELRDTVLSIRKCFRFGQACKFSISFHSQEQWHRWQPHPRAAMLLAQPCLSFGFARRVVCVCACVCAVSLCTCRAFLLVASRP